MIEYVLKRLTDDDNPNSQMCEVTIFATCLYFVVLINFAIKNVPFPKQTQTHLIKQRNHFIVSYFLF